MLNSLRDLETYFRLLAPWATHLDAEHGSGPRPLLRDGRGRSSPRVPGGALPGTPTTPLSPLFECLVNAVASQQLSLHRGITLLNRLSELCREGVGEMDRVNLFPDHLFPLRQEVMALRDPGFSRQKGTALRALAEEAAAGGLAGIAPCRSHAAFAAPTRHRPLVGGVCPAARLGASGRFPRPTGGGSFPIVSRWFPSQGRWPEGRTKPTPSY